MKKRVQLSTGCIVTTVLSLIVLLLGMYYARNTILMIFAGVFIAFICGMALFYMPLSVSVDDDNLSVHRSLRVKDIPLSEIESIELSAPTMGEFRICGSGGWFGYWGWFSQRDIGRYFAYYGKASDCFLLTLKNGKKYIIGCQHPDQIVNYVKKRIR